MKANKLMSTLGASALSLALLAGLTATPAMATDAASGIKFTKTIDMTSATGATVPAATYTYTIARGTGMAATDNSPEIKDGVGSPTIENATFTYTDVVDSESHASKEVSVDFSGVSFSSAGIYRYVITETDPVGVAGLATSSEDNIIYLDVYVTNQASGLQVTYYQMTTSGNPPIYSEDPNTPNYGISKFTEDADTYTTYQLEVTKNVEGTMGDRTKKFNIGVTLNGLVDGTKVTVDGITRSDAAADGALSVSKELANDESMVITGVPANAVYTVIEYLNENQGYDVTYKVDAGSETDAVYDEVDQPKYTTAVNQNMASTSHAVTVINTQNEIIPTGVVMDVAPYALMVAIALSGMMVFLRRGVEE